MLDRILDAFPDEEFLKADGFDEAVIGATSDLRLVYSVPKCERILMAQGLDEDEAADFFAFNVEGVYVGPKTPVWCYDEF